MLPIYSCCNSCPELVELSVVFESLVLLVHHLDTFPMLTLLLRNCGCPFHASLQLAFRAHALQRGACLMLLFLQGLLSCPNLVLPFCSYSSSTGISVLLLNVSLPCINTHLISLQVLAVSNELRLIAVCFSLRLHIVTSCASQ